MKSTNTRNLILERIACPICSSHERTSLFSIAHGDEQFRSFLEFERFYSEEFYKFFYSGELDNLRYEIVRCDHCNFYYLSQVLNDYGMEMLYNNWLDSDLLKDYYSSKKSDHIDIFTLRCLKRYFNSSPKIRLLDFGAGYGNLCRISASIGIESFAFDLSSEKNMTIAESGIHIIGDLSEYTNMFDIIWVNQVLEHLSQPKKILEQIVPCLKDSGVIFISTPNAKKLEYIIRVKPLSNDLFKLLSPHQHVNAYDNNSMKNITNFVGLKPLGISELWKIFKPLNINRHELLYCTKGLIKSLRQNTYMYFKKC